MEPKSQIIIYQAEDNSTKIDVRLEDETVWLSQKHIAELFQVGKSTISEHINNIFEEGELEREATVRIFRTVQTEGTRNVSRDIEHYNLDMIISVGYRVKSHVATRFRQWATQHIREYIVKGFVLDDERLKNPDQPFDYFDELALKKDDVAVWLNSSLSEFQLFCEQCIPYVNGWRTLIDALPDTENYPCGFIELTYDFAKLYQQEIDHKSVDNLMQLAQSYNSINGFFITLKAN